ncbi:hypothetical protein [Prosthecobacter sp.]
MAADSPASERCGKRKLMAISTGEHKKAGGMMPSGFLVVKT